MNKAKLKSYAPQARKDFIAAVEARAHSLGLSEMGGTLDIAPSEKKGDVTLIAGQAWPAKVHDQRQRLIKRMKKDGFAQTVEAVAYTWFNRFAALRYMEIHDYLDHGYRILSSREGGLPEIITHATDVAGSLPGLNASQIADMKLAGNQDGELYRLLLVAQCNALSKAMPFLFEHIDDESELLLPGNMERTDSVVAKLVESIAEEDWSEVEIIGWLYQFYISEKKDAVIGKVVKSDDIPAATQLFTPNWIVQYLVQNSVGRLWLMANPGSTLKSQWKYFIEPAEQTPEVQAQLDALIQTRMAEDGGSLNPESITVLDPACGSGHILVEAYEVLKAIYLERGYQARAIPRLILEKNLFGLDIDDRAAQMAGFALMMKARADDRRLLDSPIKLNVLSLQESKGLELDEFDSHLKPFGISRVLLASLIDTFACAKTFGSLIQVPETLDHGLVSLADGLAKAIQSGDVFAQAAAQDLLPLVMQATVLAMKFDAVVANPPYMGGRVMPSPLKLFLESWIDAATGDIYAAFICRALLFAKSQGVVSLITLQTWMFLSSFSSLREKILSNTTISSFLHIGFNTFPELNSKIALGAALTIFNKRVTEHRGSFIGLNHLPQSFDKQQAFFYDRKLYHRDQHDFSFIPDLCLGYWASKRLIDTFKTSQRLENIAPVRQGFQTGDNDRFLRFWYEVSWTKTVTNAKSKEDVFETQKKWVPYNKGGAFRKWYGNNEYVVAFDNNSYAELATLGNCLPSRHLYFKKAITWSALTSAAFGARYSPEGFTFSAKGACAFPSDEDRDIVISLLNSCISKSVLAIFAASLDFNVGAIRNIPLVKDFSGRLVVEANAREAVEIAENDWNAIETSWGFSGFLTTHVLSETTSLSATWADWSTTCTRRQKRMRHIEEENNGLLIEAYGLQDELSPDVPEDQVTLVRADREKDCQRLISYAIGCMMGRYSLDEPGLDLRTRRQHWLRRHPLQTFPADADGIVPITDELWFEDDATNRVREFLNDVWGAETLEENIDWLAESLGKKGTETPEETIRRYLSGSFYKDHLQTYKKRPIYWHFSSGKQGAFQALVYLHRYQEGTLARMRAEYVVPLTGKMQSRIEMLEKDRDAASATAARTKIAKQIDSLRKKHVELLAYDEKLRHYADMRITLDLDDGVKVNYGKFGDLLAEVKAVTGGVGED
jgi:type II restriction/modification system DNA methylase subunit YeeA